MPRNDRSSSTTTLGDLIQLPRFDAAGAIWLGEAMVAVAGGVPELPGSIKRAEEALEEELSALRSAAAARLSAAAAADPAATAAADRALDACWTALHDWLAAFTKLPEALHDGDPPSPARHLEAPGEARALIEALYPDGLSFILLPFEAEWDESERRVVALASGPLGDRVRALGGGVFLEALRAAHAAYGKVLGLPRPPGEKGGGASGVAEALEGFTASLRRYALKVTAYVEIGDPQTAELAGRLLAPLLNYQARAAGRSSR